VLTEDARSSGVNTFASPKSPTFVYNKSYIHPKLCNLLQSVPLYKKNSQRTESYILIPFKKYIGALKKIEITYQLQKHIFPHPILKKKHNVPQTYNHYYLHITVKNMICMQIVKGHEKLH
jgi:hypothetical protein